MKRKGNLWDKIISIENLYFASKKARKGKRFRENVSRFDYYLEQELTTLLKELKEGNYIPGKYKVFFLKEGKKRRISAAPYRDRVVHHCLMNILEPIFEKKLIYDTYANRKGKGTHKAVLKCQEFFKKYDYVLKCDIAKYFPSISHKILLDEIKKIIKCKKTIELIEKIINASNEQDNVKDLFPEDRQKRGIPIGNLTSQWFANIFLNPLDHFIKENLRCKGYVRYLDDFLIFANSKQFLIFCLKEIEHFLVKLSLKLNTRKSKILKCKEGVEFCGWTIFPYYKVLPADRVARTRIKIRNLRVSNRNRWNQSYRNLNIGFRCAQDNLCENLMGNFYLLGSARFVQKSRPTGLWDKWWEPLSTSKISESSKG